MEDPQKSRRPFPSPHDAAFKCNREEAEAVDKVLDAVRVHFERNPSAQCKLPVTRWYPGGWDTSSHWVVVTRDKRILKLAAEQLQKELALAGWGRVNVDVRIPWFSAPYFDLWPSGGYGW